MNMHKQERAALSALVRDDLLSFGTKCFGTVWPGQRFQPNWHHKSITYELTRLHKGENNRLIIAQPPRTLKSLFASAAWPSWTVGLDPTRQVMVITHTTSFAAELHRQFRRVVNSEWYKTAFPKMRIKTDKVTETTTTRGGSVFYCSIEGAATGRGCHHLVVDDPMKATVVGRDLARQRVSESFTESLYSRLNNKETGSITVVAQRLHEDDLIGRLLKQPDWYHLNLPAIATEHVRIPIGPAQFYFRPEGEVLHAEWESKGSLDKTRS